jgi:DNA-binding NarL/FixJ family response regulator
MILVSQAVNGKDGIARFKQATPDITLLDLRLPDMDGLAVLEELRKSFKGAKVVVLTTSDSDADIHRALKGGAAAYILKSMPREEILGTIRSVHSHGKCISSGIAQRAAELMDTEALTDREREVLELIRDGHRSRQIADTLCIAETTVNFHVKNLIDKLSANDRTHAVTLAIRKGLLSI